MKKNIFTLAISIFLLMSCNNNQPEEIVIACNIPMTGGLSFLGQSIKDGILMAESRLEDTNSIPIKYRFDDNKSTSKDAMSIFNRHKMSKFDFYVSSSTSQTMIIKDLVKQQNTPHFIWAFDPLVLNEDDGLYRVWIDMAYEGRCFINYIKKNKPKTVAFVYQDLSSTDEQFNKLLGPELSSMGIDVVYNEAYALDKKDFKDIVSKITNINPDITIIYGFQSHLAEIIKGFNTSGYKKDGNVLCSFDFLDVQNILDAQLLNGIVTNIPQYTIDKDEDIQIWNKQFYEKYGRAPVYTDAYAYDFALIMEEVTKIMYENQTIEFTDAIKQVDINGITGPLSFDKSGQVVNNVKTCKFINGNFVELN